MREAREAREKEAKEQKDNAIGEKELSTPKEGKFSSLAAARERKKLQQPSTQD